MPPTGQILQRLVAHLDARLRRWDEGMLRWWIGGVGWVELEERWGVAYARVTLKPGPGAAVVLTNSAAVKAFLRMLVRARRLAATTSALELGAMVI